MRDELGSWEAVHVDKRYTSEVKERMNAVGLENLECGEWPERAWHKTCRTCGIKP